MVATEGQILAAQNSIDIFEKYFKKGANDKIKALIKIIKDQCGTDFTANGIATAIQNKGLVATAKAACPKIIDKKSATADNIKACFADAFKDYGFIKAILKNVPNTGKDVLTLNDGNAFADYVSTNLVDDNLKAGNAYFKIVATACGTGPFVSGTDIPNPKDEKGQATTIVTDCLNQANKIAAAILSDTNCGKDKLSNNHVTDDCYKTLADKVWVLYNGGDTDAMWIDLSADYPFDMKFADLPKLNLKESSEDREKEEEKKKLEKELLKGKIEALEAKQKHLTDLILKIHQTTVYNTTERIPKAETFEVYFKCKSNTIDFTEYVSDEQEAADDLKIKIHTLPKFGGLSALNEKDDGFDFDYESNILKYVVDENYVGEDFADSFGYKVINSDQNESELAYVTIVYEVGNSGWLWGNNDECY